MARIAGVNLPNQKPIFIALTSIYGIGQTSAKKILKGLGIDAARRTSDLSNEEIDSIKNIIEQDFAVEGELRMKIGQNVRRLQEIGSYVGTRHSRKLPARGQRTKTNARTKRGKRVTVGSGRKPTGQKT